MAQQVRENVFLDRMISTLSAGFAALATLLAAIGLYGVLAYTVTQRTREFGLRMALGADGASVRGMVLGHVARMTAVGGVVGLMAAVGIGQLAKALLFELEGYDPMVLGVSALLLAVRRRRCRAGAGAARLADPADGGAALGLRARATPAVAPAPADGGRYDARLIDR